MPPSTTLPVVDLTGLDGDAATRAALLDRLRRVTHEVGFFHLAGHGIDPALADRLIAAARAFFALPDPVKLEIENSHSPHFRGYTRVGGERTQGYVDWREQLDIGPERAPVAQFDPQRPWEVLHGPNLNLLGAREPQTYGSVTLEQINQRLAGIAVGAGHHLQTLQSNAEHELIERIHAARSEGIGFINADLTVTLSRLPRSGDIGLEADEHLSDAGVAVGTATLFDRDGTFGTGTVVAVSNAGRQIDFTARRPGGSLTRSDEGTRA